MQVAFNFAMARGQVPCQFSGKGDTSCRRAPIPTRAYTISKIHWNKNLDLLSIFPMHSGQNPWMDFGAKKTYMDVRHFAFASGAGNPAKILSKSVFVELNLRNSNRSWGWSCQRRVPGARILARNLSPCQNSS